MKSFVLDVSGFTLVDYKGNYLNFLQKLIFIHYSLVIFIQKTVIYSLFQDMQIILLNFFYRLYLVRSMMNKQNQLFFNKY